MTHQPVATPEAIAQLRAAIRESGMSATAYAKTVLIRNPRTLRRWLRGDSPIPEAVREFLDRARQNVSAKMPRGL